MPCGMKLTEKQKLLFVKACGGVEPENKKGPAFRDALKDLRAEHNYEFSETVVRNWWKNVEIEKEDYVWVATEAKSNSIGLCRDTKGMSPEERREELAIRAKISQNVRDRNAGIIKRLGPAVIMARVPIAAGENVSTGRVETKMQAIERQVMEMMYPAQKKPEEAGKQEAQKPKKEENVQPPQGTLALKKESVKSTPTTTTSAAAAPAAAPAVPAPPAAVPSSPPQGSGSSPATKKKQPSILQFFKPTLKTKDDVNKRNRDSDE